MKIHFSEWQMKRFTIGLAFIIMTGCNLPAQTTQDVNLSVTHAYQTVEARLTEAVAQTPKITPSPSPESTPTATATLSVPTAQPVTPTVALTQPPESLCDQALAGVPIDVTIPDDTQLKPGEEFTKVWRLQNAGTCTWTNEYALVWFSGEQLGAPLSIALQETVPPGATIDLSVDMKAPETPGTYQSWWKLRNPSGTLFGIGPSGGSAFWVRIVVVPGGTETGTPAPPTSTPSPTATPGVQVSGSATLQVNDLYDLDNNLINNGGEDLAYQASDQTHSLAPLGNSALTVFGAFQPTLAECQSLNLNRNPVVVDNLIGNYLCYRTNMALPGWLLVNGIDPESGALSVEILTWAIP